MADHSSPFQRAKSYLAESRFLRVLGYPDFRLLWIGAFVSFTGSWITTIAQGAFVYLITHDSLKLALVRFANSFPVFCLGLFAGSFSDRYDKRLVLIFTQVVFAIDSLFLAYATFTHTIQYWQLLTVALVNGVVSSVEMPTRQSIVGRVVPAHELSAAVPINAMTFNAARILGPAIGGLILQRLGVAACYLVDGLSFLALVYTVTLIKSNLKPAKAEAAPLRDLVMEGALFTFRDARLRALFVLESITACFGLAYLPLLPAYVGDVLHQNVRATLGTAYMIVGLGAIAGLALIIRLADSERKERIIKSSMAAMAVGLIVLASTSSVWVAYPVLAIVGMAAIAQLNTTNALFQVLSPDRLRGRVLAMHIWALNGLSPFGILLCGWIATLDLERRGGGYLLPAHGVGLAFYFGGFCMVIGTIGAFLSRRGLSNLYPAASAATV